ncbi:hypothetical protein [Actinacidiphila alni]|uniref:hypothetical protein n=1 Tax=Actinacidiphila alni TaxID=380248 RepID=UPI003F4CDB5C
MTDVEPLTSVMIARVTGNLPSLAAYEEYRQLFGRDPESIDSDLIRDGSGCVLRYERAFTRPLLPGDDDRV